MLKIYKGDIVGRLSYNKDIPFVVDKIIHVKNSPDIAILKGMSIRIEADSPVNDLEKIDKKTIKKLEKNIDYDLQKRIQEYLNFTRSYTGRILTGRILHLDGDRKYADKSIKYYKRLGLDAIVKNIPERRQPQLVKNLLSKYNPDILIVTGHDAMIKSGTNFSNIYNYRNSRYFADTVKEARKWEGSSDRLSIFARCMSKLF